MRALPFFLILVLLLGCAQPSEEAAEEAAAPPEGTTIPGPSEEPGETAPSQEPEETAPPKEPEGFGLESEDIEYYSVGWEIHATVYPAEKAPQTAILLLPMLDHTRDSYPQSFIGQLHEEIPDAMVVAMDMRGHGESTNLGTWESFDSAQFKDMRTDILNTMDYIDENYPSVDNYYVVGASMGSTAAILAGAMDNDIEKIAMISPGMEYMDVSIETAADDYVHRLLLAAASGDTYSADSVYEIESISSSQITKKIYGGSGHGTDLFEATEDESEPLADVITDFLK